MKTASELGLVVIQYLDHTLLVDKNTKADGEFGFDLETKELLRMSKVNWVYDPKKIIASTRKLGDIPLLLIEDEGTVDLLTEQYSNHRWETSDNQRYFNQTSCETDFRNGYNKAKETYKFTEEDMIDFAVWRSITLFDEPLTPLDQLKKWKFLTKELLIEVEYYYRSSREFYGDKSEWVVCDEAQFNSIKKVIQNCPLKVEPKIVNGQLRAIYQKQ